MENLYDDVWNEVDLHLTMTDELVLLFTSRALYRHYAPKHLYHPHCGFARHCIIDEIITNCHLNRFLWFFTEVCSRNPFVKSTGFLEVYRNLLRDDWHEARMKFHEVVDKPFYPSSKPKMIDYLTGKLFFARRRFLVPKIK